MIVKYLFMRLVVKDIGMLIILRKIPLDSVCMPMSLLIVLVSLMLPLQVLATPLEVSSHATLPTSLVSYYSLDEVSGVRLDSVGSNDLTDNNTVLSAVGINGNAGDFELANSEYLSISDGAQSGLDLTGDFSISAWVKFESRTAARMHIVSKWGDVGVELSYGFSVTTSQLQVQLWNGATEIETGRDWSTSNGVWYHVVMTYSDSGNVCKLYVDGAQLLTDITCNTGAQNSTQAFEIGTGAAEAWYFDGLIDEVVVWSKALSSTEVSDLYATGDGYCYSGCVAVENSSTTLPVLDGSMLFMLNSLACSVNGATTTCAFDYASSAVAVSDGIQLMAMVIFFLGAVIVCLLGFMIAIWMLRA